MSATKDNKCTCSCGRSFANQQILKYHQRVANHQPVEGSQAASAPVAVAAPVVVKAAPAVVAAPVAPVAVVEAVVDSAAAEEAYLAAIEALRAKRAEQAAFERAQNTARVVDEFVDFAGGLAYHGAKRGFGAAHKLATKLVLVLLVLFVTCTLVGAGAGIGSFIASVGGNTVATAPATVITVAAT